MGYQNNYGMYQARAKQGRDGKPVKRRWFVRVGCGLLALCGIGTAAAVGLEIGGAALEGSVDAKADTAFDSLTQPLESTAEAILTDSLRGLQAVRPFIVQFLNIVQTIQQIGVNEIKGFLTDLENIPFIDTTRLQKFVNGVNMLVDIGENDLLTVIDTIEKAIMSLEQQIAEAEQNAQKEINSVVADEVHSIDFLAPTS